MYTAKVDSTINDIIHNALPTFLPTQVCDRLQAVYAGHKGSVKQTTCLQLMPNVRIQEAVFAIPTNHLRREVLNEAYNTFEIPIFLF
jgi:hypothetical protein